MTNDFLKKSKIKGTSATPRCRPDRINKMRSGCTCIGSSGRGVQDVGRPTLENEQGPHLAPHGVITAVEALDERARRVGVEHPTSSDPCRVEYIQDVVLERSPHPHVVRQPEAHLGSEQDVVRQQIAQRVLEDPLAGAVAVLHLPRNAGHLGDEGEIEKRHPHFERMRHRHRVDVAKQHVRQIAALLEPGDPIAGPREVWRDIGAEIRSRRRERTMSGLQVGRDRRTKLGFVEDADDIRRDELPIKARERPRGGAPAFRPFPQRRPTVRTRGRARHRRCLTARP